MVRNTNGGNKSKGMARKNLTKRENMLRVSQEEGEIYAQAVKVLGGNIASAIDINGNPLRAHIRGKFRGRGKRDNFIGPGTWLLVGLHSWETDKEKPEIMKNCDILEVYSDSDKTRLKNNITSVNWNRFISNDTKNIGVDGETDDLGITFDDGDKQEYENIIAAQADVGKSDKIIEDDDEVDIEDI